MKTKLNNYLTSLFVALCFSIGTVQAKAFDYGEFGGCYYMVDAGGIQERKTVEWGISRKSWDDTSGDKITTSISNNIGSAHAYTNETMPANVNYENNSTIKYLIEPPASYGSIALPDRDTLSTVRYITVTDKDGVRYNIERTSPLPQSGTSVQISNFDGNNIPFTIEVIPSGAASGVRYNMKCSVTRLPTYNPASPSKASIKDAVVLMAHTCSDNHKCCLGCKI